MKSWDLRDVVVGDPVAVTGGFGSMEKRTVTKTTATQVTLDDGTRFTRRGKMLGSGTWSRVYAQPWDEEEHRELLREAQLRDLRRRVGALDCNSLSAEQCNRIIAISKEGKS